MHISLRRRRPGLSVRVMRWFFLLLISASAVWAQPLVSPAFVEIADPGNVGTWSAGPHGGQYVGEVAYQFRMGKFEVTNDEYAAFLNAVELGGGNPHQLYDSRMGTDPRGGIAWNSSAASGSRFAARTDMGNKPVNFVNHYDAARFCNWLHNGATAGASTETGAYTLNGATKGVLQRNPGALFWVPNSSEWFKAGFYKGGGTNSGYWPYPTSREPTGSNRPGHWTAKPNGDANTTPASNMYHWENYNLSADWNGLDGNVGTVGSFSGPSAYGTHDQGGNVTELVNDAYPDGNNDYIRGGSFGSTTSSSEGISYLSGRSQLTGFSVTRSSGIGFRVAAVTTIVPFLVVRDASQTALTSPTAITNPPALLAPPNSTSSTFSIHNIGGSALAGVQLSVSGLHASDFAISQTFVSSIGPLSSVSITCTFTPRAAGPRTAQISITSNDSANSPFILNLHGYGLATSEDFDGDGLNDAAEFSMRDLGFDWRSTQTGLVATLLNNASFAGLYTTTQYNLFGAQRFSNGVSSVMASIPRVEVSAPAATFLRFRLTSSNFTSVTVSNLPAGWLFDSAARQIFGVLPAGTSVLGATMIGQRGTNPPVLVPLNFKPLISQSIIWTNLPPATNTFAINKSIPLRARSSSGLPVTYSSANTNILQIVGTNAVMKGRGTNTITARQAGNTNYAPAANIVRRIVIK